MRNAGIPLAIAPVALLLLGASVMAQQSAPPVLKTPATSTPTISVDARLVNLPVVVRDKKGALVQNLTQDSFALQVDGKPQAIRYFNQDKDLPLTLGLLVDTSMSQRDVLDEERTASFAFLDDMLNSPADRDKAFVIQFSHQTDLLQDITSSKPKLQAGLKQLDTSSTPDNASVTPVDSGSDSHPDNGRGGRGGHDGRDEHGTQHGGTVLYDALFLSSDELMAKQTGRKALIILSDGDDRGSKESLSSALEAAQRADTIVYAIYFKGKETGGFQDRGFHPGGGGGYPSGGGGYPGGGGGYPGGGGRPSEIPKPDGKKVLQRIADETGGQLFEVSKKETIADIYKQIGEELRAQYRLGFTPDDKTASDGYHRIILSMAKGNAKDFYVQTRDGYYAGTD